MPPPYRVGVVGCGVAGATTAYLLAQDGHAVTVLEQAPELTAVGAGVLLQASGQQVLKHLGLLDAVLARAAPLHDLYARHPDGRQLVNNRYADYDAGCTAFGVHRGVLFNALLGRMRTEPIDLRLNVRVVSRDVTAAGVFLTDATGTRHGPFDFVVSGDGSRSCFRKACRLPARVYEYAHGTLWVIAPGEAVPGRLLQVVRGVDKLFGLMPMGDGLATLYWGLPLAEFPAVQKRGLGPLKAEILRFAPEAAEVLDFLYDFDQLILTTYRAVWMPRWFDQHTMFLGDAAHAMSPHLGQGINLALLDAWTLARCVREAATPTEAFRAFRAARLAHLRYYAAVTFALSPFFQSDWPLFGWGRDVVLPWLPRVPFMRKQMLMTVAGLKGGFLRGRMTV